MTSADDIQGWFDAVQLYDVDDIINAIKKFSGITQSSKILFDIGCCYLRINDIEAAAENYQAAVELDCHMAIGYFMSGLTCYLQEDYESSMAHFEQALVLLRDKRCVDYRQLGLKYQLYSCEILTNQAVVACSQNKVSKAKGLLLQAVGCKAEKKHERIADALSLLQAGYPVAPFIPPQSEIFRPPKSAVDNLKKKNYLGKAKVISTENTEEIYACFSGIKDQKTPNKKVTPNVPDRRKMLSELRMPERKKTLRPAPRPPKKKLPEFDLGRVIEPPPRKTLLSTPGNTAPIRPKSPGLQSLPRPPSRIPDFNDNDRNKTYPRKPLPVLVPSRPPALPAPRKPIPSLPKEEYQTVSNAGIEEYNSLETGSNDSESDEVYEEIDEKEITVKGRLPSAPNIPPRKISEASSSAKMGENGRKSSNASLAKPGRAPPPPPGSHRKPSDSSNNDNADGVVPPPRKFYPRQQSFPENTSISSEQSGTMLEIDVQYTFVRKVKIDSGISFLQLTNLIKSQNVPENVELCFNDGLGRQQTLNEQNINATLQEQKKLFCFPKT